MKTCLDSSGPYRQRRQQRIIARLQHAWNYVQRLVMVERYQPAELVLIPIRIEQSGTLRQSKRSTWWD